MGELTRLAAWLIAYLKRPAWGEEAEDAMIGRRVRFASVARLMELYLQDRGDG